MDNKQISELEDADNWDFDRAERRPGAKPARAVLSVAFARQDFEHVARYADKLGKKTSEFIREAAIQKAQLLSGTVTLTAYTGSLGLVVFAERPAPGTRSSGGTIRARGISGNLAHAVALGDEVMWSS